MLNTIFACIVNIVTFLDLLESPGNCNPCKALSRDSPPGNRQSLLWGRMDLFRELRIKLELLFVNFQQFFFRYPPGYFVQKYTFDFFNYAGIHRPVKLYTTPAIYLSDITVTTSFSDNVAEVKVLATVSSISNIVMLPKGDITMQYELFDKSGFVVASAGGPDVFEGILSIKNPVLWWPIGMSDQPAYLYSLKVKILTIKYY